MGCAASAQVAAVGQPDAVLEEDYKIVQELLKSETCTTMLAEMVESGQMVELRKYPRKQERSKQYQEVMREIDVMRKLSHPHCATLVQQHETHNYIVLAKEAFLHGNLMERILSKGPMTETSAAAVISQVVSAIAYMHGQGVSHRNLNPGTIMMLSNDEESNHYEFVKVTNFEESSLQADDVEDTMATYRGTPEYSAPEMVAVGYAGSTEMYGAKVDVWSIGAVTYTCLAGHHPFAQYEHNVPTMLNAIIKGNVRFDDRHPWITIDQEAKNFISKCMKAYPGHRITALQCKRQKWLKTGQAAARRAAGSDVASVRSSNSAMSRRSGASTVSAKSTLSTSSVASISIVPGGHCHSTKSLMTLDSLPHKKPRVSEHEDRILGDRTCEYEALTSSEVRYSPEHFVRKFENHQDQDLSPQQSGNCAGSSSSQNLNSSATDSKLSGSGRANEYGWDLDDQTEVVSLETKSSPRKVNHRVSPAWEIEEVS